MNKTIKVYLLLFAFSKIWICDSKAQSRKETHDSLYFYLELAAKNSPTVLERFYEYQAALQKVPQVGALPDPQLSLGIFLKPMELVDGNEVADIRIMQMFPWFGLLKNAEDEMSYMAKAKYELFREAKWKVFFDVQRTMFELYKTRQNIQISEKNIQLLKTLERLTIVKYRAVPTSSIESSGSTIRTDGQGLQQSLPMRSSGKQNMEIDAGNTIVPTALSMQNKTMGPASGGTGWVDLFQIQMEVGDLENNIALLQNQQSTLQAKFNSYLNRSRQAIVSVMDTLIPETLTLNLFTYSDSMIQNNPMLDMLGYEKRSLDARKRMVSRMGYPMIGLGLDYTVISKSSMASSSMNGKDMIMPMVSFTLPIYRKKYIAMQKEAELLKEASTQQYVAVLHDLLREYDEAIQQNQDAFRRIRLYAQKCLLANQTLNILLKSFETSSSGLPELLRMRQQVLDFEYKQVEAVVDYDTSVAWLKQLRASF